MNKELRDCLENDLTKLGTKAIMTAPCHKKEIMKLNEASEPGFYVTEDDEERLYLYEVLKNTDEEWLKEEPDAILLVDEWIYVYTDYDDRKVYESNGTLQCIDLVDSFNVIRLKDKFKMFGESGQYLVQNKPTYKELYTQLLETNKKLKQENQKLKDKLSKVKKIKKEIRKMKEHSHLISTK